MTDKFYSRVSPDIALLAEREAQRERDMEALQQILHDPENQPSQFGTVPASFLERQRPLKADWWLIVNKHGEGIFAAKTEEEALRHEGGLWAGDKLIALAAIRSPDTPTPQDET